MPNKPEDKPVSSRSPKQAREELRSPSRGAPEMESVDNSGRNASELLGGFEYDWNDPDSVEKMILENAEDQSPRVGRNETEHDNSAITSVTSQDNEGSQNPDAPDGGQNLSDALGLKEMSPEEARGYGLDELFPELRKDKETENDNSTQPREPPPKSGKPEPGNMDFLGRLDLEDLKLLGFTSSDLESAITSAVDNSEVAGTDIATLHPESLAVRPSPSHATGSRYKPRLQPGNDKSALTSGLDGETAPARKAIAEASRHPPPPPPFPPADESTQGNMSTPLDIRKMACSKTLWPASSNRPSGEPLCKVGSPSGNEQSRRREHAAPATPVSTSNNDTPATLPAVDDTEANISPDLTVQDLSDAIGSTLSPEQRALLEKHSSFEADRDE